jgi:glycosyltransferase involved in cell wall biosynthesis
MKLLIFTYTQWAFGTIHNALADHLRARGWGVTIKDWTVRHPHLGVEAADHDYTMTVCSAGEVECLISYGVPPERTILVAHAEEDIQTFVAANGVAGFDRYAGYGVVSDSLACSSITLGVQRIPLVVRLGVDYDIFERGISDGLKIVGYAARVERRTRSGLEQKRGSLAVTCANAANLIFRATENTPMAAMPSFYGSIDALLMTSLQEGAGLPPLEAAAAGRLVIGTPVGHMPRLAYEGLGLLAPLDAKAFVAFAAEKLLYFKNNHNAYRDTCARIQEAAAGRDWKNVLGDWEELLQPTG